MDFSERLGWMLLGCAIGYVVARLREVKEELRGIKEGVDEIDDNVKLDMRLRQILAGSKTPSEEQEIKDVDILPPVIPKRNRDERGAVELRPLLLYGVLLIIVSITAYAAFVSQKSANDVKSSQDRDSEITARVEQVTACQQRYLSKTIEAAGSRTTYTQNRADSNVALQKAQARMLRIFLVKPPASRARRLAYLTRY